MSEPGKSAQVEGASAPLVIVGAGPAGIAAAMEAARAGLKSILFDEAPRPGGQIYRQLPEAFAHAEPKRAGREVARGAELREELAAFPGMVEVRSRTAVIAVDRARRVQWAREDRSGTLRAAQLILATGAYDRPVPFPGWTLPGVMTAGGAQTFLKAFGIRPGRRAVVAGTGPLLLVVATQLHKAGVEVAALLEAGRLAVSAGAAWTALAQPGLLKDAAGYLFELRRAGIPVLYNHTVFSAEGKGEVERVVYGPIDAATWKPLREKARQVEADLLVAGFGFVPNAELAELAGCALEHSAALGGWIPQHDERMRTTAEGVLVAGDGAGAAGALVAVEEGRVAGITAAESAGKLTAAEAERRRARPLRKLASLEKVRALLDEMSLIRPGLDELAAKDTLICRCEEVTLAQVDAALDSGARDLHAVKLDCRLGMGPCQGRNCAPSAALHLSCALGGPVERMGRIHPRPPVKPVTLGALAREEP